MGTWIAAYAIVFLATVGYAVRLDLRQRRLVESLDLAEAPQGGRRVEPPGREAA